MEVGGIWDEGDRYYQLLEGAKICTNLADLSCPAGNCRAVDEALAKTISDAKIFGNGPFLHESLPAPISIEGLAKKSGVHALLPH